MDDPLAGIRFSLQPLRQRGEGLLQTLPALRESSSPSAQQSLNRELMAGAAGEITGYFLGRKRIGSRATRAHLDRVARNQKPQIQRDARNHALEFAHTVGAIVDQAATHVGPRETQILRREVARALAAQGPETIVRRALEVVGRLDAFRPPPAPTPRPPSYPIALRDLERGIRRCVETRLGALDADWWNQRVPLEIRRRAERRRASRERVWPWLDGGDPPVIEYLSFPDYTEIMLEPRNWADAFISVFLDQDALRVKLRELEVVRNDLFHARNLSPANGKRVETYSEDLLAAIRTGM
jgi:hypothetical protein